MQSFVCPSLETERLLLRMWTEADIPRYQRICADPEVMRYVTGQVYSPVESWRSAAVMAGHWVLKGFGQWAVEDKASGNFIGRVGFFYPEGWPGLEIGWLLDRAVWAQGLATEAAAVALQYAAKNLDFKEVISIMHDDNIASQKVAMKLGFAFKKSTRINGIGDSLQVYSKLLNVSS